jgi:hypothetical protein
MTTPNPGFAHPDAACHGTNPDLFFPEHASSEIAIAQAVNICQQCPTACREACLDHALKWKEAGIWGGTTGRQRRTMRRTGTIPHYERPPGCAERCIAELRASDGKWITTNELVRRTGNAAATVNSTLRLLAERGVVEQTRGSRHANCWRVRVNAEVTA